MMTKATMSPNSRVGTANMFVTSHPSSSCPGLSIPRSGPNGLEQLSSAHYAIGPSSEGTPVRSVESDSDERTIPVALLSLTEWVGGRGGRFTSMREDACCHGERTRYRRSARGQLRQAIPPDVEHRVEPLGPVRFSIGFFTTDRGSEPVETPDRAGLDADRRWRPPTFEEGGETACLAGSICVDCGSVIEESPHRPGCVWEPSS